MSYGAMNQVRRELRPTVIDEDQPWDGDIAEVSMFDVHPDDPNWTDLTGFVEAAGIPPLDLWQARILVEMNNLGANLRIITSHGETTRRALEEAMAAFDLWGRSLHDSLTRREARLRRMHSSYPRKWHR